MGDISAQPLRRYIALLRAINVGGHTVKMDRLRALFEQLGFANVATFIASGNVIFETPETDAQALEARIEQHLGQELGYAVDTFLRTPAELAQVVAYQPFSAADMADPGNMLYVSFFRQSLPEGTQARLDALRTEVDEFHLHGRELYWLCRKKISESLVSGPQLGRALATPGTQRNLTTVRKLAEKYRL